MAKPNKNHKLRCEKYKQRGQREINKVKKQEKNKKRIAKFAKRREEGKAYKYVPLTPPPEDADARTKDRYFKERRLRATKNVDHRTHWARNTSLMRKLQNELDRAIAEEKRKVDAANGKKHKE